MEKEGTFMEVLQKVDNYSIEGKILSLNKSKMASFAKFEAIYMK
jgi:heat shock protein HslJ